MTQSHAIGGGPVPASALRVAVIVRTGALSATAPPATIFRPASGSYNIPAPPKSTGKVIAQAVGTIIQNAGNATMGFGISGLIANGLASLGVIDLPATVPGALISGAIAAGGAAISLLGYTIVQLSKDPPRFDFTVIAKVRKLKISALTSSNKKVEEIYRAQNALTQAVVDGYLLERAFTVSVDRAAGAIKRHSSVWADRQIAAAVGFAHHEGKLIASLPGLQRALRDSYQRVGFRAVVGQQKLAKQLKRLHTARAHAKLKAELAKQGLSSLYGPISSAIAAAKPPTYGLKFPKVITDPNLLASEQQAATKLAAYNAATVRLLIAKAG